MRIKLLSFGKVGYPIDSNTLDLIESLLKERRIFIETYQPKQKKTMSTTDIRSLYNVRRERETVGIIKNLEAVYLPGVIEIFGDVKPKGYKADLLKTAIEIKGNELRLLPRVLCQFKKDKYHVLELFGFDLFESKKDYVLLMTKWVKLHPSDKEQ